MHRENLIFIISFVTQIYYTYYSEQRERLFTDLEILMSEELKRTELYQWHVDHGGRMVPFAGWEMPVQYPTGPIQEHHATRQAAGLFDIDHMG
jgi:hypothetical protein